MVPIRQRSARVLALLLALALLSACSAIPGARPVMPLAAGLDVYLLDAAAGPAPTVFMLPGCGGMRINGADTFHPRVARRLNAHGFNVVALDYVRIMGLPHACAGQIKPATLRQLIVDALHYTASQPYVDRRRISLLGWSLGASAALTVAEAMQTDAQLRIAAVAAYYPGCYRGLRLSTQPTLLLLGLGDDVVNPYDCLILANRSPQTPLTLKTYAGAQHGFDVAEFSPPQRARFLWKTFTSAYDEAAAADAERTLFEFLQSHNREAVPR